MSDRFFVFDYDGVLADSLAVALEEYRRIGGELFPGVPLPNGPDEHFETPTQLRAKVLGG